MKMMMIHAGFVRGQGESLRRSQVHARRAPRRAVRAPVAFTARHS